MSKTRLAWCVLALGLAAGGLALWLIPERSLEEKFPYAPYSENRFLNTGPAAQYIGVEACAQCHQTRHESYLLTAHSRALADLDPKNEPPDGAFYHAASQRHYRVYRKDKQMRHEEVVRRKDGKEIARVDLPIRYLIGSGNFTRSYLVETNGFLYESPITWYASKNKWDMSPGYDSPGHLGFERPIGAGCLFCHVGRLEETKDVAYRPIIYEKVIGCESCHGPGALHRDLRLARKLEPDEEDLTIVNPGKLSRSLQEAICSMCHPAGLTTVPLRGRQITDFRPGRPMTDYRIDYSLESADESMKVVGHLEQMRQSACYQKSTDLTCITCHDLHARVQPKDKVAHFRQKCLQCHAEKPCRVDIAQRTKKDGTDNCAGCHMPRGDTDIPHIAFAHHRIGVHPLQKSSKGSKKKPVLAPIGDIAHVPPWELKHNLGMAYATVAEDHSRFGEGAVERARELLEAVHAEGLREGESALFLGNHYLQKDPKRASEYLRQAVTAKDPKVRAEALTTLAIYEMTNKEYKAATGLLEEAVRLLPVSQPYYLLGMSHVEAGQFAQGLPHLRQALQLRPYRNTNHAGLARAYQELGDAQRANEHLEKARWLVKNRQD